MSPTALPHDDLDRLRRLISTIDAPRRDPARDTVPTGWSSLDRRLSRGLRRGVLHEWLSERPPLFLLAWLAARALEPWLADERPGSVLWIGEAVWPYPHALVRTPRIEELPVGGTRGEAALHAFELALARPAPGAGTGALLERSLFLDPPHDRARLWAADVALRSRAVAAVVLDGAGLPIAATRRLQLAARAGEALALLARPAREERELSCAATRFRVRRDSAAGEPGSSEPGSSERGSSERGSSERGSSEPGSSEPGSGTLRWSVELLRAKSQGLATPPTLAS